MSIGHPIPELWLFQNLTLKINGQGHAWGHNSKSQYWSSILLTHIPFVPCQSALPFLRYSIFISWPWKSRVKVIGEVTVQSHNVGLASYRLTSLFRSMSISPPILEVQHFQNLTLKIKGQGYGWGHNTGLTSYQLTSLLFHVNRASHSWVMIISKFDLENQSSRSRERSQFKVTKWV